MLFRSFKILRARGYDTVELGKRIRKLISTPLDSAHGRKLTALREAFAGERDLAELKEELAAGGLTSKEIVKIRKTMAQKKGKIARAKANTARIIAMEAKAVEKAKLKKEKEKEKAKKAKAKEKEKAKKKGRKS